MLRRRNVSHETFQDHAFGETAVGLVLATLLIGAQYEQPHRQRKDIVDLLHSDHEQVKALLNRFDTTGPQDREQYFCEVVTNW